MDSSPRKKVRIDDKVTEIKSKNYHENLREDPLIPFEIVDEAFQRIFILSLFILLQSWKIYDLIGLNVGSEVAIGKFSFVFKYAMLEGVFFWFLPILNVSYLTFSPIMTLLITIIFNIINILIINKLNVSLVATVVAPLVHNLQNQKELSLSGERISPNIDIDSHFSGKYTIHYLPDSLAKFNVFGLENVCQGSDKEPFQIPIQFNTTTDVAFLEIEHTSPLNTVSYHQYGESQINKLLKRDYSHLRAHKNFVKDDDRVFYMEIPVKEPGTYRIKKIRDRRGSSMRYVQNEFSFASCPQGQFSVPKSVSNNFNNKICVGKVADDTTMKLPLIMLDGAPPMTAKILASFKGKKVKVIESTIKEDSSLNVTGYYSHKLTRNLLEQEVIKDPSILKVSESGSLEFQLLEVKDSLGNVKKYNPQADTPDLRYSLDLLTKPSLRLIDMESSRPLLVNGTKGLSFAASKNIVEQFPITARFNFEDPVDSLRSYNFTHIFKDLNDMRNGVQVANPGHYKLLSVIGNYCDCEVQDSVITFETVEPPSLSVDAKPVMDKCVGMTGYNFKFEAQGKPPFAVEYSVYLNSSGSLRPLLSQGRSVQVLRSDDSKFEFDYKPPGEGSFVIIFKSIRDAYYKSPISLDESKHTYLTYFKQRSRVSFFDRPGSVTKVLRSCQGESNLVPVHFNGHFPFKFDYSIVDSTGKAIVSKVGQVADGKLFEINTDGISGGSYDVVISNIADGIGCTVDYNVAEKVQIITRSDTPQVSFDTSSDVVEHKIVEGDYVDIPLKVVSSTGRSQNDKIEYEVTENGITKKGVINGMNSLRIRNPGVYKLSSFVNGGCKGSISSDKTIHVSFYDKPSLSVKASPDLVDPSSVKDNIILKSGCQGCKRDISLDIKGKGPFVIEYEIKFPSGKTDFRTMTVERNTLDIKLSTSQSGIYQHVFKGVYDQLYTKEKVGRSRVTLPSVSYSVYESPLVEFSKASTVLLCEASLGGKVTELSKLPIALRGQAPFKIDLSISGENMKPKSLSLDDISLDNLDLNNVLDSKGEYIWKNLKQGEYVIKIEKVEDVNGCIGKDFSHFNQLVISVTPAPDISPFKSKKHFCVGDHVGYDLVGAAPFNLHYTFNNNTYNSQTEAEFRRLAAKPGIIQVTGIEDSSAGRCLIDIEPNSQKANDLELTIHDLPSVEINQGDSIIQDIHEGDLTEMKFTFTGTPPFTVTYVRTLDPSSTAKRSKNSKYQKSREKITETTTVKDIWEYNYSVNVGLEGTYEAIEIRDAYCVAKKDIN